MEECIIKYKDGFYLKTEIGYKKIILTTDQDLIADGVQPIDDDFLQWWITNPNCENVEIKKEHDDTVPYPKMRYSKPYRIIIPGKTYNQEIVGYRLKPTIDRLMVDRLLKYAMPIWNNKDKSVYFIKGHVAGSLVAKLKELQVLDFWFTPIYKNEEVKSDWVKESHLEYYRKEGIMKETLEEVAERLYPKTKNQVIDFANGFKKEGFFKGAEWQAEKMYSEENSKQEKD